MAIEMHSHWYPAALVEALKARTDLPHIKPGTDGSAFGAEWSIRAIEDASIEDWEKQAILDGTAATLLSGHTAKLAPAGAGAA